MREIGGTELSTLLQHLAETSLRRSELSAERCFQNAERNLSLLIHSCAALMILGVAVDRSLAFAHLASSQAMRTWDAGILDSGVVMVTLATLAVLAGAVRYLPFVLAYHRNPCLYPGKSAFLAPAFALLVGLCGIATLIYMLLITA
jgi:uncharacterized membrane protein YidH (DUF202 family)